MSATKEVLSKAGFGVLSKAARETIAMHQRLQAETLEAEADFLERQAHIFIGRAQAKRGVAKHLKDVSAI